MIMDDVAAVELHLTYLRAAGRAARTVQERGRTLRRAGAVLAGGLDAASTDELAGWLATPSWSRATRYTYWGHLAGYYAWALARGRVAVDPMAGLSAPPHGEHVPDPVTDDELRAALAESPDWPWRAAVMLAAYAGLRAAEACALRRDDVTEHTIRVRAGKGGRDAVLPTHPLLWGWARGRPGGLLVRSVRGLAMTPAHLVSRQAAHWRRLGLPGVHLHRFRHWYATALLRAGADLRTVQELMRHRCITSTQGYTQVVDARRRAALLALPVV